MAVCSLIRYPVKPRFPTLTHIIRAENYKNFGATLEFVSDRSSEGNQFVKGFGGIGAILRYKLNFEQLADLSDDDEFYDGKYPPLPSDLPNPLGLSDDC